MKLWQRCLFLCVAATAASCEQNKINSAEGNIPSQVGARVPTKATETNPSDEAKTVEPNLVKEMAATEPEKTSDSVTNLVIQAASDVQVDAQAPAVNVTVPAQVSVVGTAAPAEASIVQAKDSNPFLIAPQAIATQMGLVGDDEHDIVSVEAEHVSISPTVKLDVVLVLETPDKGLAGDDDQKPDVSEAVDEFVKDIDAVVDVNVAVISSPENDGVKSSEEFKKKGHKHIALKHAIKGSNILAYLAAASCAKEKSDATTDPWSAVVCDHVASNPTATKMEDEAVVDAVRGWLNGFYRQEAKRIYIFSSRQDSDHFKAIDFKAVMESQVLHGYHVFGLMPDLNDEKCYELKTGKKRFKSKGDDLKSLIAQTGGKALSVCQSDWKKQFREIATAVLKKTNQGYAIPAFAKVTEVSVDDIILTAEQFSVSQDEKVYIKKGVLKDSGQKVKIKAQKKQKKKELRALKKEERKKEKDVKKAEKESEKESEKAGKKIDKETEKDEKENKKIEKEKLKEKKDNKK